jgi:hypothetical protein
MAAWMFAMSSVERSVAGTRNDAEAASTRLTRSLARASSDAATAVL